MLVVGFISSGHSLYMFFYIRPLIPLAKKFISQTVTYNMVSTRSAMDFLQYMYILLLVHIYIQGNKIRCLSI